MEEDSAQLMRHSLSYEEYIRHTLYKRNCQEMEGKQSKQVQDQLDRRVVSFLISFVKCLHESVSAPPQSHLAA